MIKTLAGSIRQYKKQTIMSPVTVALEVFFEIMIPLIMAKLIDEGIDQGDMGVIWKYGLILLAVAMISLFCGAISGKFAAQASSGFAKNLRQDIYYKVQEFSFANIDKFSTASLVTRMTTDITNIQMAFQMIIRIAVRSPIMLVCALFAAFKIDAHLSLIYVITVPILGIGLYAIIMKVHPIFERVFKTYDHLNAIVQENLYGIRVVKSFTREDHEVGKFDQVSDNIYRNFVKAEQILAFNMPLMQLAVYTCMLLICWLGARAIVACGGDEALGLSTGEFMSLFTYTMQILMSLMMLSMVFVMLAMSVASAERICEVLNEKSDITNPENADKTVPDGSITFDHVTFRYSKTSAKPVLSDIDLSIKSGETIGIIGGTGSSKSSLVNLISRLYDVSEGRVLVGGKDVRSYDLDTLRNEVSVVLQNNVLFSGTIYENLRWGDAHATDEECRHACRLACADEFIERFPDGYNTYIEQGGTNVSGGQKQRLCIARALLKKPKILILPATTSAVDTATDAKIRRAFLTEIPNTTKLIIAQRISSVQDADRIIVLDNGELNGFGTHEELLQTNAIYRDVYESQTGGGGDFDEGGAA